MNEPSHPPITVLTPLQRRILGTLIEKGLTTLDSYPLTLKSLLTGCNQKSNREPVSNYTEDDMTRGVDQLRQMGLVSIIHSDSSRVEKYRHQFRHRITLTEPQVAIMAELLLRGRQQLGELRTRASRMVPIDTLDALREALLDLQARKMIQANGALERRGIEVDHAWYKPTEEKALAPLPPGDDGEPVATSSPAAPQVAQAAAPVAPRPTSATPPHAGTPTATSAASSVDPTPWRSTTDALRTQLAELQAENAELKDQMQRLTNRLDQLCQALGVS